MKNNCADCKNVRVPDDAEPCANCVPTHWQPVVAHNPDELKLCADCKHESNNLDDEPCLLCVPLGDRKYWEPRVAEEPKEVERSCDNCRYEKILMGIRPCKLCRRTLTHWEPKPVWESKPVTINPIASTIGITEGKTKKKSKWHTYPEEKPKDVTRAFWVWNNDPDPRMMKLHFYVGFDGNNFVTANGSVLEHVTHFRYMPKPPKEYRK